MSLFFFILWYDHGTTSNNDSWRHPGNSYQLCNILPKMEINEKQIALNSLNCIDSGPVLFRNSKNGLKSAKVGFSTLDRGHKYNKNTHC